MTKPHVEIWAEAISELLYFIETIIRKKQLFIMENLLVAKGAQGIGSNYLTGKYREYSSVENDVLENVVDAPGAVTDLVQWCCPDVIITKDRNPVLSLEFTYHEPTWNNVAQRLPRLVRAAACDVPSIIFQKCDKNNPKKSWVAEVYRKLSQIYGVYSLPIFFSDEDFEKKRSQLLKLSNELIEGKNDFKEVMKDIYDETLDISANFSQDEFEFDRKGLRRKWLPRITHNMVEVHISVKQQCGPGVCATEKCTNDFERMQTKKKIRTRDRKTERGCMWLTKGTGGLDPYPGLIKLSEILCCYNNDGQRIKTLLTKFRELSEDFWWFKKFPESLYYRLIKEFSDEILYKGQTRALFTQASMIIKTRKFLSSNGWTILYDDLPSGSRSGIGRRAEIFHIFDSLFNAYPDVICVKDDVLLVVEVDHILNSEYIHKLNGYLQKSGVLKEELATVSGRKINSVDVGFAKVKGTYSKAEKENTVKRFLQDENLQIRFDTK